MKKIVIMTATRADYGLLSPIIKKLINLNKYDVRVVATGMHLSPEFGNTYKEIEEDGIVIDRKISMLLSSDDPVSISKSMALALIGFADYFDEIKPDMVVLLGDRFETLAVAEACLNARIPIVHLYGGEISEGAIDDVIRHAVTKMSYYHFTSTDEYRNRVIQLGESPDRVFSVGAMGVENSLKIKKLSFDEFKESIGWEIDRPYAIVTFHPVTLENNTSEEQIKELIKAFEEFEDLDFVITKANADSHGRIINELLMDYSQTVENVRVFDSLGKVRYLSALKYSAMVIGNSSSGLVEAPSFSIPTVNIGDRQSGRLKPVSVIDCEPNADSIIEAIKKAKELKESGELDGLINPYGDGNTSDKIVSVIDKKLTEDKVDLKKKFYNV